MEKQKIDTYNAGYQAPVPVELGRWYEKVSQKDIDDFNGREEERRRNWAENKQREKKTDEDTKDDFYGDIIYLLFHQEKEDEK